MECAIFWFRRDLRLDDNIGFHHALSSGLPVIPIFIFDENILEELKEGESLTLDKRLIFIHRQIAEMNQKLQEFGSTLLTFYGNPIEIWTEILNEYDVKSVYTNHDYEPYAIDREAKLQQLFSAKNIDFKTFKDQVIFEKSDVVKADGKPYTVFTPYSRRWKEKFSQTELKFYPSENLLKAVSKIKSQEIISLEEMGFQEDEELVFPSLKVDSSTIAHYQQNRDFPYLESSTSKLGVHLRFGTISIRKAVQIAIENKSEIFLNELIWREFYMMILWHFPHVVHSSFKPQYDNIVWENDEAKFEQWKAGKTGYPIVDAGMRELNATGYMHNRVRMIAASFLIKHLLIDWRWGEAYFAKKLLDFELSSNNGGWQWAASSGCDAAPYFRVFNPTLQMQKFDSKGLYVKKWVKEFGSFDYPQPIVVHEIARKRVLEVYQKALK
jgi:deoxyribodipyrimidine photo-lyase